MQPGILPSLVTLPKQNSMCLPHASWNMPQCSLVLLKILLEFWTIQYELSFVPILDRKIQTLKNTKLRLMISMSISTKYKKNMRQNEMLSFGEWRIYASVNKNVIGSDNDLSSVRCQAFICPVLAYQWLYPWEETLKLKQNTTVSRQYYSEFFCWLRITYQSLCIQSSRTFQEVAIEYRVIVCVLFCRLCSLRFVWYFIRSCLNRSPLCHSGATKVEERSLSLDRSPSKFWHRLCLSMWIKTEQTVAFSYDDYFRKHGRDTIMWCIFILGIMQ